MDQARIEDIIGTHWEEVYETGAQESWALHPEFEKSTDALLNTPDREARFRDFDGSDEKSHTCTSRPGSPSYNPDPFELSLEAAYLRQTSGVQHTAGLEMKGKSNFLRDQGSAWTSSGPEIQSDQPQALEPEVQPSQNSHPGLAFQGPFQSKPPGSHALMDYQMQLMLLEQQDKRRLLKVYQEKINMAQELHASVSSQTESKASSSAQPQPLDNVDFLRSFGKPFEDASLSVSLPDGSISTISRLSVSVIAEKCPLLAFSFEASESGPPRACIEGPSRTLVVCFLRYLYTGDYCDSIRGCSILIHAQICHMAEVFEVPELQVIAHTNVIRETEASCSQPVPPADLCEAIRYIFEHLANQKPLVDTILHYCVHCFLYHKLNSNLEFKKLTFEIRKFTQELCRTSFQRGFGDEGAVEIVRLQTEEPTPFKRAEETRMALGDFLYDFHGLDLYSDAEGARQSSEDGTGRGKPRLAYRPKPKAGYSSTDESEEEATPFGFMLVRRPIPRETWVKASINDSISASETDCEIEQPEIFSRRKYMGRNAESNVYEADYSMSESESDFQDHIRRAGAAKIGSLYARRKEADEEDLLLSFATIKPVPKATDAEASELNSNNNNQSSDSEWSLV